jgi:RNA polymerase sigma-70 factor, ECF subfamily
MENVLVLLQLRALHTDSTRRSVRIFHSDRSFALMCAMSLASLPDSEIVARCRRNDEAAWHELVTRFSRYVYAITTRVYRLRADDSEDVFQEVFARTYVHLNELRDDAAIRAWIGQTTRRLAVDRLRGLAREDVSALDAEVEPAEIDAAFEKLDEAHAVHGSLQRLPEHCREILDRFFARDESYRTIGDALSLPAGTIASRISRCLQKLREELEGRNLSPETSSDKR